MPISPLAVVPGGGGREGGGLEEARPRQHTRGNDGGAGRRRRETAAILLHVLPGNKRRYMVACGGRVGCGWVGILMRLINLFYGIPFC